MLGQEQHGKRFRIRATGEEGQLEAPPLHDAQGTEEGQGILWLPAFGGDSFLYVHAEEIEQITPKLRRQLIANCDCWVADRPEEEQFQIRFGAHALDCPKYRESGDPVDREQDEALRRGGEVLKPR